MKKSKFIKLVLVAGLFVGCQSAQEKGRKVYLRTDSARVLTQKVICPDTVIFSFIHIALIML